MLLGPLDGATRLHVVATTPVNIASGLAEGQLIDGQTLVVNWLVLLTAQTDTTENGVYEVPRAGVAPRHKDFLEFDNLAGMTFYVMRGATYGDSRWSVTSDTGGVVGTTPITLIQDSSGAVVAALAAHVADLGNPHGVTKAQVGLDLADNTPDTGKPVSTAQQTALDLKANLLSPAFGGTPTTPTPTLGDTSTLLANMAAVAAAVAAGVSGLVWKPPVEVVAIANIALTGEQTIDGVLTSANRVAVTAQTAPAENGIYVSAAGAWARSTDMNAADKFPNAAFLVRSGTVKSGSQWKCTNTTNPVVGTDPITIEQIGAGLLLDYSDQPEAEGATNNDTVMTPLRTGQQVTVTLQTMPADQSAKLASPPTIKAWGYRWPIFAFAGGETERAKGSGHATADFQVPFNAAIRSNERIKVPPWQYPFRSYIKAVGEDGNDNEAILYAKAGEAIDIQCSTLSRMVIPDTMLNVAGAPAPAVFLLARQVGGASPSRTDSRTFKWRGGRIDASALTDAFGYGGGPAGSGMFGLYDYRNPTWESVVFDGGIRSYQASGDDGERFGAGFMDTAIGTHDCFGERIFDCVFMGFYDVALYWSGDSVAGGDFSDGPGGQNCYVARNNFFRCAMAATAKRAYRNFHFEYNFVEECFKGLEFQSAGEGNTTRGRVNDNSFSRCGDRLIRVCGPDVMVTNNTGVNFGRWLDDPTTKIPATKGIYVLAATNTHVKNNTLRQEAADWLGEAASADPVVGIDIATTSTGALVGGNRIESVAQAINDNSDGNNLIEDTNVITGEVVPSVYKYHADLGA